MHMRPHVGPTHGCLKCYVCEEFRIDSPQGLGVGCKSMQNPSICDHKENNDHKSAVARWEALHFPSLVWFLLLIKYVQAKCR